MPHAADTIRRRAAVIGFRAGMIAYILESKTNKTSVVSLNYYISRKGSADKAF